jgi:glycerophosphoryl diester phosphodiesterase
MVWEMFVIILTSIPTFKQVIKVIEEQGLCANVEIKTPPGWEEKTVRKVLSDIENYWPRTASPPLISSFSMLALKRVREYSPTALIAILIDDWFAAWDELAEEYSCASLDINHEILDAEKAKHIKASGKFLLCYTVNNPQRALELFSWGVDAVFTDRVEVILGAL